MMHSPQQYYNHMLRAGMSVRQIDSYLSQIRAMNDNRYLTERVAEEQRLKFQKAAILTQRALDSDDDKATGVIL